MGANVKTFYGVTVTHLPCAFEPDMVSSSESPAETWKHYLVVRDKYKGRTIKITETTIKENTRTLSEHELEILANQSTV